MSVRSGNEAAQTAGAAGPVRLHEIASLIRSKNAGPFDLTFDIMFDSAESYQRCVHSGVFQANSLQHLVKTDPSKIRVLFSKAALAIKISIPRPVTQGDFGDPDSHGGQQYAGLLMIEIL
ncbi:MAG TPA: DUF4387 domain-containing protein [Magnetospirillaceae bacterium]|jgi:hypothetical protein